MKVRRDEKGLYIANARGDGPYRPGGIIGYDHAYDMSYGGLQEGDNPRAYHVAGAPLLRIKLDGRDIYWAAETLHKQQGRFTW